MYLLDDLAHQLLQLLGEVGHVLVVHREALVDGKYFLEGLLLLDHVGEYFLFLTEVTEKWVRRC